MFNLPIPGWLPASSRYGVDEMGTRYGLYATAKFVVIDDGRNSSWSFSTLCAPFLSSMKSARARKRISLNRLLKAPSDDPSPANMVNYFVSSLVSSTEPAETKTRIPPDVLSRIQVITSTPEYVNMEDVTVPLILRVRSKGLDESECKRLQLTDFSVNLVQKEECRFVET